MVASNDGIFKLKFVRRTVAVSVHIYRAAEGTLTAGKRNAIERQVAAILLDKRILKRWTTDRHTTLPAALH